MPSMYDTLAVQNNPVSKNSNLYKKILATKPVSQFDYVKHAETLPRFEQLVDALTSDFQDWEAKRPVQTSYVTKDGWRAVMWSSGISYRYETLDHSESMEFIATYFNQYEKDGIEFIDSAFVNEHGHRQVAVVIERTNFNNEILLVIEGGFLMCRLMKY